MLFLTVVAGIQLESWWAFGGALVICVIVLTYQRLMLIVSIVFSGFWAVFALGVGLGIDGLGAGIVLGVIAFLISLGMHAASIQLVNDITYSGHEISPQRRHEGVEVVEMDERPAKRRRRNRQRHRRVTSGAPVVNTASNVPSERFLADGSPSRRLEP